jgi:hypothetical protein
MRVLCVLGRDPFAQRDGTTFAMRASLARLAARAEVTVTGFGVAFAAPRIGGYVSAGALDEPANHVGPFLAALARGRPYSLEKYASRAACRRYLALLEAARPDVVWYEPTQAAGVAWRTGALASRPPDAAEGRGVPLHVLRSHNVEFELVAGTRGQGRPLAGLLLRREAANLRRAELGLVGAMDRVLTVTAEDAAAYAAGLPGRTPGLRHAPIPAAAAGGRGGLAWGARRAVVFLGRCEWGPNAEAATWIRDELAPALATALPELTVRLVGAGSEAFQAGGPPNLSCAGFVEDLDAELGGALCALAPVRSGGGVNVKVLESLARGLPVVGVRFARRGVDSAAYLEAETAADFVARIRELREPGRAAALSGLAVQGAERDRACFEAVLDEALSPRGRPGGGR